MATSSRVALCAGLATLALIAAACGGDGSDDDDAAPTATRPAATATREAQDTPTAADDTATPALTAEPTAAPPTVPPPTAAPIIDMLTVTAADFAFSPGAITVNGARDTRITLTNAGAAPHTMTVYRDAGFTQGIPAAQTQPISGGASADFTLTSSDIGGATQLFFRCEVHPSQMQGTIAVQ